MSATTDITRLGAAALARAVQARELSCREVVDAALERIEAVDPSVNAVRVPLADEARAQADRADARLAAGEPAGPLQGVPFTVKENVDVAGTATTHGVAAFAGNVAPADAPAIAHLRAAGAIPVGRANMGELALRWHTQSALGGATRNPRDPELTPGGSSGGDAVAVATGMAPLGVGNDLGGSLRFPSQCCGTVAIRPSLGRVARASSLPPRDTPAGNQLMNVDGPLARSVADLELALAVMSAPDPRDPWHVTAPLAGPPAPRRVAVMAPPDAHPDVQRALKEAAGALAHAGYELTGEEPPRVAEAAELWAAIIADEVRAIWPAIGAVAGAEANAFVAAVLEAVPGPDGTRYAHALSERQAIAREWAEHTLILAPICTAPPFKTGEDLGGPEAVQTLLERMRAVVAVNLLGLPAVAIHGIQVIGPRLREDLCLEAAKAIEAAHGAPDPIDPQIT
ncbi:MAG TPA: amidase [Solirubrobacteraceae bacterium]